MDGTGALDSIEHVVTHEVTHVMVFRATRGRPVPRWFNEGVAQHEAGQETAWLGLRQGGTLPMSKLEEAFQDPARLGTAYAESSALVEFLVTRSGEGALATILREVRRGADFSAAFCAGRD